MQRARMVPRGDAAARELHVIEAQDLTRTFDSVAAVTDLTFSVAPGEILGFLGPNGAGKSTTVKMLTGMLHPTRGTARVAGFDVAAQPLEVKRRLGYVPESGAVYDNLSAAEYLELVASLHHLPRTRAAQRADELLELFDLIGDRDRRIAEFSKGMRQKVLLSAALLPNPEVLFLDEPLTGLDANAALVVKELLRSLAGQGKTIFFCSHILEVVERICSRIIIIDKGRLTVEGRAADICRTTGSATLEEAFSRLTGTRDVAAVTRDFLAALEDR
ncbi:MAG: ABC transporter ATP-binding protein [Bacteroidales bacterium]